MSGERCARCRFWRELDGRGPDWDFAVSMDGTGLCRRYPPVGSARVDIPLSDPAEVHDSADAARTARWPVTYAEDWCGEYRARLEAVA